MKISITSFLLFAFWMQSLTAQNIRYEIIEDSPELTPNTVVNLDLFQLDMNGIIDSWSFNIGLWGYHDIIKNKIAIDYNLKKSWLALGKLSNKNYPGNLEVNIGADLFLINRTKNKKLKISLNREYKGSHYNYAEGTRTDNYVETSVMIPGKVEINSGFRGGLYYKSNAYEFSDEFDLSVLRRYGGKMTSAGIYGGVMTRRSRNLFIKTEEYGISFNSIGDEFYIDALILPYNKFMDNVTTGDETRVDESEFIKQNIKSSPFGFRVGWKSYQIAKKAKTGKKFGMSFMFEAGLKPYLGPFLNGGLSITLIKNNIN